MNYVRIAFASAPVFVAGVVAGFLFGSGTSILARAPVGGGGGEGQGQGCAPCPADIDNSNSVDINDLLEVINNWGACPVGDLDCDGFTVAQGDCDDNNAAVHPGATELCNTIDDDCDTLVDEGFNLNTDFNNCGECGNSCNDGLACTIDACTAGICTHNIMPGFCVIAGQCVTAGTFQPGSPCMMCNPAASQTAWTPAPAGTLCPGGVCNGSGTCIQ